MTARHAKEAMPGIFFEDCCCRNKSAGSCLGHKARDNISIAAVAGSSMPIGLIVLQAEAEQVLIPGLRVKTWITAQVHI